MRNSCSRITPLETLQDRTLHNCGFSLFYLLPCLEFSECRYFLNLEELIKLPSPRRINFSVCLSVCLFHMKTRRILMQELKSGCPRGVSYPSSIPSEYLFLCGRRKFGFNKKICTKLLIVYVYIQPNSCNTHAECEWAQGTFLRQRRKVPPAHVQ